MSTRRRMHRLATMVVLLGSLLFPGWSVSGQTSVTNGSVRLLVQAGYLSQVPVLVRAELLNAAGERDKHVWDAEGVLVSDKSSVALSTNRIFFRNGVGSVLVGFNGTTNFNLGATVNGISATCPLEYLGGTPVTSIGGTLPGTSTTWSGIINVTNDVIVPTNHVLTIRSNTVVMLAGVTSGTGGADLIVRGSVLSLGTEAQPVTFTVANATNNWGEVRHTNAAPSFYLNTVFTKAGRSPAVGHTGSGPAFRLFNSQVTFDGCSLSDNVGKIMHAEIGSDVTFTNCLLSRSIMGPEIDATALQLLNSYIIDMRGTRTAPQGTNDNDGIYLHGQRSGQAIRLSGCVIAGGDDDGIDTLGSTVDIEDCIIRDYKNQAEDSKGISILGGEVRLLRSLVAECAVGISGKGNNNESVRLRMDRCTVVALDQAIGATNKSGTTALIDYRITNSILRAVDAVFTDYDTNDIHIEYSNISEPWPGTGNITDDPLFVDAAAHDFRLETNSPCIDAGNPAAPLDADGTRADMGVFAFERTPNPPQLLSPRIGSSGLFELTLSGDSNRVYSIDASPDFTNWTSVGLLTNTTGTVQWTDTNAISGLRFYRGRLVP
jgi:hypothetical protein